MNNSKIKINPDALKPKREWKRHKVVEGSNVYRFLPPFGEESNGYPYRRWMVLWGLLDPESGRLRPYASPITSSEKACPVMEFVGLLTDKAEVLKAELKAGGLSEDGIKERLKPLNKTISNLRPKGVYAWNAVDKAGIVGLIEIKSTAQKKLKELMNEYLNDYAQDPTSINSEKDDSGVWFNIKRNGTGFDTTYDVEKLQTKTKIDGVMTFVDDRSSLPDTVVDNWESQAYDLGSIYQVKTYDQVKEVLMANMARIIEECPDALVPGFEPIGVGELGIAVENSNIEAGKSNSNGAVSSAKVAAKKAVTTRFDDEGEDLESASVASPPTVAAKNDDVFSMADDILGN